MTSQATKIRREETGRPSWTSCCPVWGTPWGWETSGDSRTCVTETEEVKFIFDEDFTEQQCQNLKCDCKYLKMFDCLNYILFALLFFQGLSLSHTALRWPFWEFPSSC